MKTIKDRSTPIQYTKEKEIIAALNINYFLLKDIYK